MTFADWLRIIHPILAVVVVYPLIGIVVRYAWQTRERRLQAKAKVKSKIPPVVGAEHVNIGRWLTGSVVGLSLIGLAHPIFKNIVKKQVFAADPGKVAFIVVMFVVTIASLALLYKAKTKGLRALFTTVTSAGLIILGLQDGVFRRTDEWFFSHYYYGITAAILMVISLGILPEIYKKLTWRNVHIALNMIALLLFLGQGVTGARDLLEIPLSWQEPTVFGCDFVNKVCAPPAAPQ